MKRLDSELLYHLELEHRIRNIKECSDILSLRDLQQKLLRHSKLHREEKKVCKLLTKTVKNRIVEIDKINRMLCEAHT